MGKIKEWLMESNRWKHLFGGLLIGILALGWYNAVYAGVIAGGALEYKDRAHGGAWDWTDFGLTVAGSVAGGMVGWLLGMNI